MKTIVIDGELRQEVGKKSTKQLKKEDKIPCVIYGGQEVLHFSVTNKSVKGLVYTPDFHKVELNLAGTKRYAILKAIDFHPVTDKILHIDFQELVPQRKVFTEIPVRTKGLAEGVKKGGRLTVKMKKLKIKALPVNLVSEVVIDVTELELGKSVRVSDLDLQNVEILSPGPTPVASVEVTRAAKSAAAAAEE